MVLVCSHHSHISPTLPEEEVGLKITLPATHSSVLTTLSLLQILNCITLIIHIACISVKVRQWVKCHLVILFASAFSYQTTSISHRPFPTLTSYSIHAQIQRGFELGVVTPPPSPGKFKFVKFTQYKITHTENILDPPGKLKYSSHTPPPWKNVLDRPMTEYMYYQMMTCMSPI